MNIQSQNYINHIALVLDASMSMTYHRDNVVKVVDGLVAHLARRSKELDQETRITVYIFSDDVRCVIYDKDVLRLPSIKDFYKVDGNTALIAATMKSQDDLAATAQLYGDHSFLTYVLTDGEENVSKYSTVFGGDGLRVRFAYEPSKFTTREITVMLQKRLTALPDNWTVACLVPDARSKHEAKSFGFPADNIAIWDTKSAEGVAEVGDVIRQATDTYMTNRTLGIRGSKTIFAGGTAVVNRANINAQQGFKQLPKDKYSLLPVLDDVAIRPFVEAATGRPYVTGTAYYQLTKPEKIQPQKEILVRNRKSGRVYQGQDARSLLSLPNQEVRVKPEDNAEFQIFVQSTSVNRKLVPGTKLLVLIS